MKKCPQCGTVYSDVTLSYCLQDGTPLVVESQAEIPTVVLGETETAARRDAIRVPIEDPAATASQKSQVTQPAAQPARSGSNTILAVLLTVIGMLILFGVIGVLVILWPKPDQASVQNTNNSNLLIPSSNSPTPLAKASPIQTPASTQRPSPQTTVALPPQPPVLSHYPATTRLAFAHGAYTTSFSGDVNPGDSRSLVLACRSGQTLSATVTSGRNCVNVAGGGPTMRTTTTRGDNYITLTNGCSSVAHFSISITVL